MSTFAQLHTSLNISELWTKVNKLLMFLYFWGNILVRFMHYLPFGTFDPPQLPTYSTHTPSAHPQHAHTQQTHMYLYGVGRYPPGKIAREDSLCWSVLWKFREAVPLDDVSLGTMNNRHIAHPLSKSPLITIIVCTYKRWQMFSAPSSCQECWSQHSKVPVVSHIPCATRSRLSETRLCIQSHSLHLWRLLCGEHRHRFKSLLLTWDFSFMWNASCLYWKRETIQPSCWFKNVVVNMWHQTASLLTF